MKFLSEVSVGCGEKELPRQIVEQMWDKMSL